MTRTRVVNIKHEPYDVYIGRENGRRRLKRSDWHNPFKIGPDGTREEVLEKYEAYIRSKPDLMARLGELDGKVLACWCKPEECHGDVLVRLLESRRYSRTSG
jgi:Domain of unknown function (DUF4326)